MSQAIDPKPWKRLGEDIRKLMFSRNVSKLNFSARYPLPDEVIPDVNMFSPPMEYRVSTKCYAPLIVFEDNCRLTLSVAYVLHELSQMYCLLHSRADCHIFSLC